MSIAPITSESVRMPLLAPLIDDTPYVKRLQEKDTKKTLAFLVRRPVHTAILRGMIRRNGIAGENNRGHFYGYYDARGELQGVALIGAASLFETRRNDALAAFARLARESAAGGTFVIEDEQVELFWRHYAGGGRSAVRLHARELLMQLDQPAELGEAIPGLRQAVAADLDLILPVHAAMCLAEKGVDPSVVDARGFRARCLRRIEGGQTWVWIENGKVIFKADVVADTPEAVYLEAIYVCPAERRKGYGLRCLAQMCDKLLRRTARVSLLVDERNSGARALYARVGYKTVAHYDTIILDSSSH